MMPGLAPQIRIRKYGNRRLYDTSRSHYITLEELAAMVRAGNSVQVSDAKDGRDLTRAVLTQAILEEQERLDLLPVDLLEAIIRVQGTFQQAPFFELLRAAAGQFNQAGRQMAGWFGAAGADGPAAAPEPEAPMGRKRKRRARSQDPASAGAQERLRELLRRLGG